MKKNILVATMALAMAFTTIMGSTNTLTVYATDDGLDHGDGREPGGGGDYSWGDTGSSSGASSSGGGSASSSHSSDDGADHGDGREAGGGGDYSWNTSSTSTSTASAPVVAGSTTGVTGKEQFRALAKSGSGSYKVTHKGIDIATFTLMDADKKAVPCTAVALKQRADGKWAIDFQVTVSYAETTQAADTTGLTVGAPLDRTYMYTTLGVSYVTINDTVVIDIEAEAAAKTTK